MFMQYCFGGAQIQVIPWQGWFDSKAGIPNPRAQLVWNQDAQAVSEHAQFHLRKQRAFTREATFEQAGHVSDGLVHMQLNLHKQRADAHMHVRVAQLVQVEVYTRVHACRPAAHASQAACVCVYVPACHSHGLVANTPSSRPRGWGPLS